LSGIGVDLPQRNAVNAMFGEQTFAGQTQRLSRSGTDRRLFASWQSRFLLGESLRPVVYQ
jgi:hypothetical protein